MNTSTGAKPCLRSCLLLTAVIQLICVRVWASPSGEEMRILAIGNSITLHAPASTLGWTGNWGMAASSQNTDYVGQLAALLKLRKSVNVQRLNLSAVEKDQNALAAIRYNTRPYQNVDLLILELGDNVERTPESIVSFRKSYAELMVITKSNSLMLRCLSTWWERPEVNAVIRELCEQNKGVYINISDLYNTPEFAAKFDRKYPNAGVAAHPSDRGMKAIAERLFNSIASIKAIEVADPPKKLKLSK